jgi:hypothetical protein
MNVMTSKLLVLAALVSASTVANAQPSQPVACCRVSSIDVESRLVAAKPMTGGATFNFKFDAGPIPATLKIDQLVWARGGKVSLNGTQNCCTIVPSASARGLGPRGKGTGTATNSYAAESTARVRECNQAALTSFPRGGHTCTPKGTVISTGKRPDESDATYSWTCACS